MDLLPPEIWEQIIYHMDVEDLPTFCEDQIIYDLCGDSRLWKYLFLRDKVKLMKYHDNFDDWIGKYRKSVESNRFATHTLDEIESQKVSFKNVPMYLDPGTSYVELFKPILETDEELDYFIAHCRYQSNVLKISRLSTDGSRYYFKFQAETVFLKIAVSRDKLYHFLVLAGYYNLPYSFEGYLK